MNPFKNFNVKQYSLLNILYLTYFKRIWKIDASLDEQTPSHKMAVLTKNKYVHITHRVVENIYSKIHNGRFIKTKQKKLHIYALS